MKICFLTGEYPPMQGGVADHTAHLARHLVELGVEVSILTSDRAASNLPSPISHLLVYPLITRWDLGCWRQITRFLDEQRPDVLHIQYQAAAFDLGGWINWLPWRLSRRLDRLRIVVTFHDLRVPYLFPKAGPLRWRSILALARYSDAVIVTNVEDEQTLRKALGIGESGNQESGIRESEVRTQGTRFPESPSPSTHTAQPGRADSLIPRSLDFLIPDPLIPRSPDPLTLIPLGSNVEPQPPANYDRRRWRARLGVDDHTLLLAYFGFLNDSKGGEDLVLALDELVRRGYNVRLMMIGGQMGDVDPTNRAYADRVRSLIQARRLADRVYWTGYTSSEQVSANLLAADVVVMPYRDGVSFRRTTFIAALRHGRPVVTTHPTIPVSELSNGDNVLLVTRRDVGALTEAAARLADDALLRHRLAAGAEVLGRRFDWSVITRQTLDLYWRLGLE